ncbi:flavin reductase family protein [Nocardioides sp. zg-536]|uniref:Flavin reductase family protein n=1 Tax=Nocardioides faecalis TaxID=2803858 RepID=A0A939BX15_9ACTN|nr:flavin reductase family protein [Nocardioides faecalis]MBM9458335.1 flavin reductase family protein [Nocardioides faecalis]MBS4753364.1 flavin reductase family protein [Nocardioides faecalis]QVI58360.1 flavin reductase family protein [Nocardioides faecalis]
MSVQTISQAEMRSALGRFASGVTVITGTDDDGPVGFACQSFASVSLDPPLVLFCADHGGRSWPRIRRSGRFTVNVLAEDQDDLCHRFGRRGGLKFDGLDYSMSRWGTPSLDDVLVRVHAEVETVHVAGDHDVVIGRVVELEQLRDTRPMVFFSGRFGIDLPVPVP